MDLFKKIYLKEGKGIDKDQPEKRAFFRFWEIAWFKRYKLMAINLLYVLTNLIPIVLAAASYIVSVAFYFTVTYGISVTQAIEQSARPEAVIVHRLYRGFKINKCFVAGGLCIGNKVV